MQEQVRERANEQGQLGRYGVVDYYLSCWQEVGSSPESSGGEADNSQNSVTSADIGKRVVFFSSQDKREKYGTLRYYGRPEFSEGLWCGVELDKPEGKNNGSKHGIRYFTCQPGYGVFVPLGKVERDSSRRSRSRPNSRPGSRPSSAERGKKNTRADSGNVAVGVRPTAVQQELARLAQAPVTDRLAKRKAGQSSVTNWRKPLKAFAHRSSQSKDDAAVSKQSMKSQVMTFGSGGGGMHKAASTDNLRALRDKNHSGQSKPVKKSSSERNLSAENVLTDTRKSSVKRSSRPNSVSTLSKDPGVQRWSHDIPGSGVGLVEQGSPENVTSSQSSLSSSRGSSPEEVPDSFTSNGFVPTSHILPTSVSVTLPTVESERHYAGHCHTSSPGTSHSKQHSPDESTAPLSVVQLVHQVMQQNKELQERQGMLHTIFF